MTYPSIEDLLAKGKAAEDHFLTKLDYDTVTYSGFDVTHSGYISHTYHLRDTFQEDLSYVLRYMHGGYQTIPDADFYDSLTSWPNREQRELYVLAAQVAPLTKMAEELRTAQVLAFVARLQPDLDELRRLLPRDSVTLTTPSAEDDDVPF